jgi:hypothetical protein
MNDVHHRSVLSVVEKQQLVSTIETAFITTKIFSCCSYLLALFQLHNLRRILNNVLKVCVGTSTYNSKRFSRFCITLQIPRFLAFVHCPAQ